MEPDEIETFHAAQSDSDRAICDRLRAEITSGLPEADSKVWHAHPVWFLDGNPIVGYSKLKNCIRLMFWSGQSFPTPGLKPEGSFKAAELRLTDTDQIDSSLMQKWLAESRDIQWDYKNVRRNRGLQERLK